MISPTSKSATASTAIPTANLARVNVFFTRTRLIVKTHPSPAPPSFDLFHPGPGGIYR
jgi:hypothetical protein